MKRGSTREKRGAVVGVLLFDLLMGACVAGFGALCFIPELPRWLFILFAVSGALCAAPMAPALWALKKRFQEIDALEDNQTVTLCKEENIMVLVNIDYIPGKEFEVLGMAKGTVVQSKNFGKDFIAGMKTLVGGEITGYTEMLNEARQIAVKRMVDEAEALGADAVINIRYGSSAVMQGAAEVIAYGTAVRFKEEPVGAVFVPPRFSASKDSRPGLFALTTLAFQAYNYVRQGRTWPAPGRLRLHILLEYKRSWVVMFGLFGKKEEKSPEERLAGFQNKKDWAGLSKAYYEMGKAAMDRGDLNHAQLWLHRADTIYSADDATCEKVGDKIMDDCSDRIGALEEEDGLLYNALPAQIEEKAEELNDPQLRIWGMLSIARLANLGVRLARLPGCEVLGELGWAVDMMFKSIQEAPSQEEYQRLMSVCNGLYELNSKPAYYTGEIEVPGKAPFQVFDLNGMMGVEQELNSYIDNHLRLLAALSQGAEPPAAECGVVGCTILPDYRVRTGAGNLEEDPQIKAELERIWSDFAAVRDQIPLEEIKKRIAEYKQLDILTK